MDADRKLKPIPGTKEKRSTDRRTLTSVIGVNSGLPFGGGTLRDVSKTGVAVQYPDGTGAVDSHLKVAETVKLTVDGLFVIPARVARTFDNGFAVQLECDLDVWRTLT